MLQVLFKRWTVVSGKYSEHSSSPFPYRFPLITVYFLMIHLPHFPTLGSVSWSWIASFYLPFLLFCSTSSANISIRCLKLASLVSRNASRENDRNRASFLDVEPRSFGLIYSKGPFEKTHNQMLILKKIRLTIFFCLPFFEWCLGSKPINGSHGRRRDQKKVGAGCSDRWTCSWLGLWLIAHKILLLSVSTKGLSPQLGVHFVFWVLSHPYAPSLQFQHSLTINRLFFRASHVEHERVRHKRNRWLLHHSESSDLIVWLFLCLQNFQGAFNPVFRLVKVYQILLSAISIVSITYFFTSYNNHLVFHFNIKVQIIYFHN